MGRGLQLTQKQKLFCEYYLKDFNATQAYGVVYKVDSASAGTAGQRLLQNVATQQYIKELVKDKTQQIDLEIKDILTLLKNASFMDIQDFVDVENYEEDLGKGIRLRSNEVIIKDLRKLKKWQRQLITRIEKKKEGVSVTFFSKEKAVEMLGRYFKLFTDKIEIEGEIKVKTISDLVKEAEEE